MTTQTQTPTKTSVRRKFRRCVRRVSAVNGVVTFESYSFSRAGREIEHEVTVNLCSGEVRCGCEHFRHRLARLHPTLWSPRAHICHHIERAIANCARRGELPQQDGRFAPACALCGSLEGEFEMCDECGEVLEGQYICAACVDARMDDLSDAQPIEPHPAETHHEAPRNEARLAWTPPARRDWREMSREERDELFNSF
jgi:hypothetical protein